MIRINLLGQARPKAQKQAVPLEATLQILLGAAAVAVALVILSIVYFSQKRQLDDTNKRIAALRAERQSLQAIKLEVTQFESQKAVLQQRINVIETLQKNRTGGQDLLQMVANTVVRVDSLWLTSLDRKGNSIQLEGTAGSINAVANFITQLKTSGYFDQVDIKESTQDTKDTAIQTFTFTLTAQFTLPQANKPPAAAAPAAAAATRKG